MEISTDQKKRNIVLLILSALIFSYVLVRAYVLSITWDEAYTYIEFARNGKIILDKYELMSANNHILNTALMILFTKAFGVSEIVMRIPSLITLLLFLFYSAKLVKNIHNFWLCITAFLVITVNPYLLDFFCMARGYGLSIGLMMCSIYYFYQLHVKEKKIRFAFLSVFFACLAVLANFVLLNYCVVLFGLIALLFFYNALLAGSSFKEKALSIAKGLALPAILMFLLFLFIVPIAIQLKEAGALFFGGERGFWADTVSTITDRCFYEMGYNYWLQRLAKGFVFLILAGALVFVAGKIAVKKLKGHALFLASLLLLLGLCCLSTVVQHKLMETPYLLDRTALFLVVLFDLIFVFFIAEFSKEKAFAALFVHASAIILIVHFCLSFNLHYVLEWKLDADTKEMLSDLEKIKEVPKGKETVSIGIPLIFDPAINFYREKNGLDWLNTVWRNETTNPLQDYFFLSQDVLASTNRDSIEVLKTYPGSQHVLARPKYPSKELKALVTKELNFENEPDKQFVFNQKDEYGPTFSYIVNDSVTPDKRGIIAFYADVAAPDISRDNLIMVISFQTAEAELYSWQKAYIKDFIKTQRDGYRARFTCIVPQKTRSGDEIKAYIWNPEKQMLHVKHMDFKWLATKN